MSGLPKISRRGLLGVAAALGAAGLAEWTGEARATPRVPSTSRRRIADRPAAQLPPRREFLVRGGYALTMDPALGDFPRGDVHVRAGEIVAVGPDLVAPGAEVLDARDMIVLPGFVETHWHLWNTHLRGLVGDGPEHGYFAVVLRHGQVYTPEDAYRGVRLGLAEALDSGITTVHDWSHNIRGPEWADADLRALSDVGLRARFSYGKRADLILVRTTDLNLAPVVDPVLALVHGAQPANVDTVVVDGRILKRAGQFTALDPEQVVREAAESLAGLRARAGTA